jgi:hypothetical protein
MRKRKGLLMKYKDFEEYLQYKHSENYPEILDDMLPDAYNDWISNFSEDDWIFWANRYAMNCVAENSIKIVKNIGK